MPGIPNRDYSGLKPNGEGKEEPEIRKKKE